MLISDDPRMAHLRRITEFYFYPQVDPEGRWQGHYGTGPINPTVDHNRIWDNPVGNPEVQIIEAAMQADTGGTVEYFFDFHGMWRPRTELASSPPMYNSDFPAYLLHYVDPVVLNVNWDVRFGHVWAESAGGLNATYAATPEIGSVPLWKPDRWLDYGAAYALAFFDMLELPPMGDLDGDLDLSGAVDIFDLNMVLIDWGKAAPNLTDPRSDGNGDGTVDIIDLNMVLIDWGKVPQEELIVVNGFAQRRVSGWGRRTGLGRSTGSQREFRSVGGRYRQRSRYLLGSDHRSDERELDNHNGYLRLSDLFADGDQRLRQRDVHSRRDVHNLRRSYIGRCTL